MIAASDPLEYSPGGRQTVARHPASRISRRSTNDRTIPGESILLQKFSQVNISEKKPKEFWLVRENETCGEEELYCSGRVAVHSKGDHSSRILQTSYTCETDIKQALWCTFRANRPNQALKEKNLEESDMQKKQVESICLIDSYTLKVFTETGEDYVSSLQFQVSSAWATKYGILLEKTEILSPASRYASLEASRLVAQNSYLPVAFSLTHPLDEICPLLMKHGNISYMCESNQQIVFTSCEPSLAVLYDTKTGLHSVYKIRKALAEECQIVSRINETTLSGIPSAMASPLNIGSGISLNKSYASRTHFSLFGNNPFGSRGTSYTTSCSGSGQSPSQQQQQQHSRSQSPMATISRCQSPTHPAFSPLLGVSAGPSVHQTRLHQTVVGRSLYSPSGSYNSIQFQDTLINPSRPLYPEICLDHVWTENTGVPRDVFPGRASKVLLTSDLVGQRYLGYLVPSRLQLFLVRLEKANKEQQIIFGIVTSIVAKDAVDVPKLNMIATLDLSYGVTLYSGVTCVGKVHMAGFLPNLAGCNYFTPNVGPKLNSPFPRRSSLISQNCAASHDIKFEEALHLLSPVAGPGSRLSSLLESSLVDANLLALKDAVGHKVTLEYGNKTYYRMTLPSSSTSPLVTKCLKTLRSVLQRDLAMQLLIKWYGARNAPGPQDFSPIKEWQLFLVILLTLLGYDVDKLPLIQSDDKDQQAERHSSPIVLPKKQKTNDCGTQEDWSYVANSTGHSNSQSFNSDILKLTKLTNTSNKIDTSNSKATSAGKINSQAALYPYLPLVLFSLHLLYEDMKLNNVTSESLSLLAQLLYQLSTDLKFELYSHHYFIDFPSLCYSIEAVSQINAADLQRLTPPNYMPAKAPSIFDALNNLLNGLDITYPYLNQVNRRTKNIVQLVALIAHEGKTDAVDVERFLKLIVPAGSRVDPLELEIRHDKEVRMCLEKPTPERIVLLYHEMGLKKKDLEILPTGVSLLLMDIMHKCRERPPADWPKHAYELVDRQDLAALNRHFNFSQPENYATSSGKNYLIKDPEQDDGMEFDDAILKLRFNKDHRVAEVRRLLNSSKPVRIAIVQRPDVSDHEFIEEQERHLHALCTRTMALPVARGMFTLRTSTPIITEQLPIPRLCLTGKAPPRGTTVELAHIDVPPNLNLWPLFHNGVAAGLRIHPDASNIDSTWIVYNKQQQGEFGTEHSGFLMALGLNGHLKNLAPFSMYEYLVEYHEATSVGLLLGLSATHRGSMDVSMTKLLSLHVETLLPPTSIELNVPQNVQVAALMGVGLVYQETAHKHIAQALMSEIGRPPGPEMKNYVDRESYSLAAGLGLGLVALGCGGRSDLTNIPDTLHYYMVGGNVRPFTGAQKDKYKSPSYQIREGDSINIDVTSPGATIALGLMYFNTGNRAVAEWMRAPDTQFLLDFVRPDLLLLRILARSLILWDKIEPTVQWVACNVPDIVYKYRLQKPTADMTQNVDLETMNQAYCNIVAGACMALGLKYAGTANVNAFKTLHNYARIFKTLTYKSIAELAGKSTIETCLNVILLATAVVMAGTGNLKVMRICRHIRTRVGPASSVVTYGSHLATHMALGLLFLGGGRYTLSNSPRAVAALVIALFPKFPTHSNDNRYHLQALRHLYVLAVEPRLLLPRDIDNAERCYATVHLHFKTEKLAEGQETVLRAPCLLPQLKSLKKVEVKDDRYWEITFERDHNWHQLMSMLSRCDFVDVKQRAGCLSYQDDPHGFRSLVAQTLTTENVIAWAARPEHVTSFTNDKTVLNMVKYFLQKLSADKYEKEDNREVERRSRGKTSLGHTSQNLSNVSERVPGLLKEKADFSTEDMEIGEASPRLKEFKLMSKKLNNLPKITGSEGYFLQNFAIILYECVVKDKVSLLPLWVNLFKSIEVIERQPNSYLVWQIKLASSRVLGRNHREEANPLLSTESILGIKQKLAFIMDGWEVDLKGVIKSYFTTGIIEADPVTLAKLSAYFTYYDIPYQIEKTTVGPFSYTSLEGTSRVPDITSYKLYMILNTD